MKGIVYKIVNKITLEYYVGSTINYKKRISTHKTKLKKGVHSSKKLQQSYDKYGKESFDFIIVCETEKYRELEQDILNKEKNLYNSTNRASGGDMISNHPNRDEIIKKSIERLRNAKPPKIGYGEENPNWRGGISKTKCVSCGKTIIGYNTKCKKCYFNERDISGNKNPFYGKTHSEETKEKLRNSHLGKINIAQSKQLVINGIEYINANEASRYLNIKPSTIRHRVISKNPKFENYKYKEKL